MILLDIFFSIVDNKTHVNMYFKFCEFFISGRCEYSEAILF